MIALVLAAAIGCAVAIGPAIRHDNELPIRTTGRKRK